MNSFNNNTLFLHPNSAGVVCCFPEDKNSCFALHKTSEYPVPKIRQITCGVRALIDGMQTGVYGAVTDGIGIATDGCVALSDSPSAAAGSAERSSDRHEVQQELPVYGADSYRAASAYTVSPTDVYVAQAGVIAA